VTIDAPDELDGLPAAVEVAAYRISLEAMTNVARHAEARACIVHIALNGDLQLEVVDDGRGLPDNYRAGVGITSMRERAEELGGTCEIESLAGDGTRVHAILPLGSA
jgi:signal transduction histidine kinase